MLSADYNRYMDIQQSINLNIHRRFGDQGIAFAVTTQNLVLALAAQALAEKSTPEVAERNAPRKRAN